MDKCIDPFISSGVAKFLMLVLKNRNGELNGITIFAKHLFLNDDSALMDHIDLKILEILKRDSRTKYVKIAEAVGLTEGAVRRRVKRLVEECVIKSFTIETTTEFEGIVLIGAEPTRTREITSKIRTIANRVFEVSGDYDIAALIQAYTMEELNSKIDEIRRIPSVLKTGTLIKLKD